jgi:hypothetical protein
MKKLVLIFMLFVISCKKSDLIYAEIYYVPAGTSTPFSIHCDLVDIDFFEDLKTKKIYERETLKMISSLVNKLQPTNPERDLDARVKMIIYYESKSDTLCLGEFFGTRLNGQNMKDNEELFMLLRKKIYD